MGLFQLIFGYRMEPDTYISPFGGEALEDSALSMAVFALGLGS